MDESYQCAFGIVDVHLSLTLEVFSSSYSRSCCLNMSSAFTIWCHLSTWTTSCLIHLGTLAAAVLVSTGADTVRRAGHSNSCPVTVWYVAGLSYAVLLLDHWRIGFNFVVNFAEDPVIDDPVTFCNFLEGEFAANIFRSGSKYCFWFQQVWLLLTLTLTLTQITLIRFLRTGLNFPCLDNFGFPSFGSHVVVHMYCLRMHFLLWCLA